ncbi:MAG: glycosyltransferase family 4 protein [Candidatus Omnitrophica bacterium]|nr:glycosyltransferase family 4 protein [Candidatus Omnitrophota bacterium]
MDHWLARRTDKVIAVSHAVKDYYHRVVGIAQDKIAVIPNAIDVRPYEQPVDISALYGELNVRFDDFILACVGRLNAQKGHPYLFEALKNIVGVMPDLKVLIVGDGEDKDRLMTMADEAGIMPMLRFTGQRQDIPQILQLANALVLPSIYEGLPLCVLEAMAAGRPVIATDVGGTTELAIDGETAFIVEPRRSDQLTDAIVRLRRLPDGGLGMGSAGRDIVNREFTIQVITQRTQDLFQQLLEAKT